MYTFFYKNQIISAQARCSYSKMAKISIFSQTLPLFMRLKCFSERAVSFTTSQWFVTSLVLELALPIDLNPRLTVLIKFVLIKEKKCTPLFTYDNNEDSFVYRMCTCTTCRVMKLMEIPLSLAHWVRK